MILQRYIVTHADSHGVVQSYSRFATLADAEADATTSEDTAVDLGIPFALGDGVAATFRHVSVWQAATGVPTTDGVVNSLIDRFLIVSDGVSRSGQLPGEMPYVSSYPDVLSGADTQDALAVGFDATSHMIDTQTRRTILTYAPDSGVLSRYLILASTTGGGNLAYDTFATQGAAQAAALAAVAAAGETAYVVDLAAGMAIGAVTFASGTSSIATISTDLVVGAVGLSSLPQFAVVEVSPALGGDLAGVSGWEGRDWTIHQQTDDYPTAIATATTLLATASIQVFDRDNLRYVFGGSPASQAAPQLLADPWAASILAPKDQAAYLKAERRWIEQEAFPGGLPTPQSDFLASLAVATCRTRRSGQTPASCVADWATS